MGRRAAKKKAKKGRSRRKNAGRKRMVKAEDSAVSSGPIEKPHDWDRCVSVAYLRLLGATQKTAAKAAGCAERSIRDWEACVWWPEAQSEARSRWLQAGDAAAMQALFKSLDTDSDATTARWWAERRMGKDFAPPKQRHELGGSGGGAIPVAGVIIDVERLTELTDEEYDAFKRIAAKLGAAEPVIDGGAAGGGREAGG